MVSTSSEIPFRLERAARRGDRQGSWRLTDVGEDALDRWSIGDGGDQAHLGAALGAGQRQNPLNPGQQGGQQVARRGVGLPWQAVGLFRWRHPSCRDGLAGPRRD